MISARIRDLPFAQKVFLLLFVTLSVSIISSSFVSGIFQVRSARKELVASLQQQGAVLAHSGGSALVFQDDRFASQTLSGLAAEPSFVAGRFMDENGEPFASYPETAPDMPTPPESGAGHAFSDGHLDVWCPVFLSGRRVGSLWLRADTRSVQRRVSGSVYMLGVTALIALAVGLALSLPLQRTLVRPVGELARVAREVTAGQHYDLRAKKNANDELGTLTDAFNDMMRHIEEQNHAMRLSEQRNRDLFESAPVALWEEDFSLIKSDIDAWRADGITDIQQHLEEHAELVDHCAGNVRVLDVNSKTLESYGAGSKTEFEGALGSFFTPESTAAFRAGIVAFADGNTAYECEAPNRTLHGEVLHFLIRWTLPPECETTWSRVLVSTVDITEQWRARNELSIAHDQLEIRVAERTRDLQERTQDSEQLNKAMINLLEEHKETNRELERVASRLQASNKELESFSYSVSHDLRAPLRHVDGFIRLLIQRERDHLDSTSARYLETIAESSNRMGRLIDDLLAFSRTGRAALNRQLTDSNAVVQDTLREMSPREDERDISWKIDVLPSIKVDGSLLRIVWENLIGNAIKYTRQCVNPRIEIGTLQQGSDETIFFIRDNGAGFDSKYKHKLFGVFQRLHRNDEFEGTGIGLATVQRIVHRHGGRVWAEGEVGKGATFYFTMEKGAEDENKKDPAG